MDRKAEKLTYTINEAVAATGVSRSSLYRMRDAGALRMIVWSGRTLIRAEDLRAALDGASGRRSPPSRT